MGSEDWYRNRDWDDETAVAFETKLKRARAQKWSYLRIQGGELADTHPDIALQLLRRVLDSQEARSMHEFDVSIAFATSASILRKQGEIDAMLDMMEGALDFQDENITVQSSVTIDYPALVVLYDRTDRFERAWQTLGQDTPSIVPWIEFAKSAPRAIIGQSRDAPGITPFADRALAAAAETVGPDPANPQVGLVPDLYDPIREKLADLISGKDRK